MGSKATWCCNEWWYFPEGVMSVIVQTCWRAGWTFAGRLEFLHLFGKCLVLLWIGNEVRRPLDLTSWEGGVGNTLLSLGLCTAFCCESTPLICSTLLSSSQDKSWYCLTQVFTQTTGQLFNGYCSLRCCRTIVGSGRAVLEHGGSLIIRPTWVLNNN